MDVKEAETLGTGLTDVIRLLLDLPTEQLLSLTYQLGKTPEEDIVHALSLLFLHKETQGLDRLQALQDNSLANHLAKKWHTAGGKLEDFGEQCGHLDNVAVLEETLAHLARIFKVLSEKRLCAPRLRDLAYWKAVSACGKKTNNSKVHHLIEEAKFVCGPQFAVKMHSQSQPEGETEKASTALSLSQGKPEGNLSMPSSLQASSSFASYPTHLEISLPPTVGLISDQILPVKSQHSHPTPPSVGEDELENNAPGSYHSSNSSEALSMFTSKNVSETTPCSIATTDVNSPQKDANRKQTTSTPSVRSKSPPAMPVSSTPQITVPIQTDTGKDTAEQEGEEEEEEEEFFAFVILHAAEDVEMAEAMKERMESICGLVGATFSEDFALPGKSSLRCIDDAIENSAFTILLLTNHFTSTRQFQVEAESALINSIQQRPKYNTVIPLLPRENAVTKASLPLVLQTLVPLEDNKRFEKMTKRVLSAERVRSQRKLWLKEQQVKKELRRQERMKLANKQCKVLGEVHAATAMIQQEKLRIYMEHTLHMQHALEDLQTIPCAGASSFPCTGWPPQNIHVENAKYIMIGNDSKMTVDFGGSNTDDVVEDEDN